MAVCVVPYNNYERGKIHDMLLKYTSWSDMAFSLASLEITMNIWDGALP